MRELSWDYFTGTSWLGIDDAVLDCLPQDDIIKRKVMQYDGLGQKGESGWFTGLAIQSDGCGNEFQHSMIVASGESANKLRGVDNKKLPQPKRIDFQVTVIAPKDFKLGAFGIALKSRRFGQFMRRGRYPAIDLILSDSATVYIGKRGRKRMIRLYEKWDAEALRYIRFELELGGEVAPEYKHCVTDIQLAGVLLTEFRTLPALAQVQLAFIGVSLDELSDKQNIPRQFSDKEAANTFRWLISAITVGQKMAIDGNLSEVQAGILQDASRKLLDELKRD